MKNAIILALLTVATLAGQSGTQFLDGSDWEQMGKLTEEYPEFTRPLKRAYVAGLLDGKYYYFLQAQAVDSALTAQLFSDYLSDFNHDELVRGTDEFYKDPYNRYLPIVSALAITALRAKGFPEATVDAYTQASRDWIDELATMYSHEVPIALDGISRPNLPISIDEVGRPKPPPPHKWYKPDSLVLP